MYRGWEKENWGLKCGNNVAICSSLSSWTAGHFKNLGSLKKVAEVQMGPSSTFPMSDLQSEEF